MWSLASIWALLDRDRFQIFLENPNVWTVYEIKITIIPSPTRCNYSWLTQCVSLKVLLEGRAPWVWWLYLKSTVVSLMQSDQRMQNYSWLHILDNPKTTSNTIICSKYREQCWMASRPSSGTSCITGWQVLVCQLMAGETNGLQSPRDLCWNPSTDG